MPNVTYSNHILNVTVQDWFNDPGIPFLTVTSFYLIAKAPAPSTIWTSIRLDYKKIYDCWDDAMSIIQNTENPPRPNPYKRTYGINDT